MVNNNWIILRKILLVGLGLGFMLTFTFGNVGLCFSYSKFDWLKNLSTRKFISFSKNKSLIKLNMFKHLVL